MSDLNESLNYLLKNFTKINDVTTEARDEINKYLKLDNPTELAKKCITKTVLNLTNTLLEEVTTVRKFHLDLSNHNTDKSVEDKLVNADINTHKNEKEIKHEDVPNLEKHSKEENKENEGGTTEVVSQKKPMLKIVDFSKLVDPRNLELMDQNHKRKEIQNNTSVIVLSSSDEEPKSDLQSKNQKLKKTVSQESRSDNRKVGKTYEAPPKVITKQLPNPQDAGNHNSINSDKSKDKLNEHCGSEVASINKDCVNRSDDQFKNKPYVKLLRIPCEKMKSFYSANTLHNENNVSTSKSRTRKLRSDAILDEKTGEMVINSKTTSDGENESRTSNMIKSANTVSRRNQSLASYRKSKRSKQNNIEKVLKNPEKSISSENSDDSSKDVPSKVPAKKKHNTEEITNANEKRDFSKHNKNCSSKIVDIQSKNVDLSSDKGLASVKTKEKEICGDPTEESNLQNKLIEKPEQVLEGTSEKDSVNVNIEVTNASTKLNFDKTNNKQLNNRFSHKKKLPVPLSDSENDSSDEGISTDGIEKRKQQQKSDDGKSTAKSKISEDNEGNVSMKKIHDSTKDNDKNDSSGDISSSKENKTCDKIGKSLETSNNDTLEKTKSPQEPDEENNLSTNQNKDGVEEINSKKKDEKNTETKSSDVNKRQKKACSSGTGKDYPAEEDISGAKKSKKRKDDTQKGTGNNRELSDKEDEENITQSSKNQDQVISEKERINSTKSNENNSDRNMKKKNTELDSLEGEEVSSKKDLAAKRTSQTYQSDQDMFENEEQEKFQDSCDIEKTKPKKRPSTPATFSILPDSEVDESSKEKNQDSSDSDSPDKEEKRRKTSSKSNARSKSSHERNASTKKKKDSDSFVTEDNRKKKSSKSKSSACSNSSDEENESTIKKKRNSSGSDSPVTEDNCTKKSSKSSASSDSSDEENESTKKKKRNSSGSDSPVTEDNRTKKSSKSNSSASSDSSDEENESTKKKKRNSSVSDSPATEDNRTKKSSKSSASSDSSDEENESTKKKKRNSSGSDSSVTEDYRKKKSSKSSACFNSSDEENESTKKKKRNSLGSVSPVTEDNRTKKSSKSSASSDSSDGENESTKKKKRNSSGSDVKTKTKRSGINSSDKEENSEDSEDFSTFYKKNKMLKSRHTKKTAKKIQSDSDDDNEELKKGVQSGNSGSEYEKEKSDEDSSDHASSNSETKKNTSRKRRIIKNNDDSSDNGDEAKENTSKKRKIIKTNDDSSDSSDAKTTRKKIKKLISKDSLSDSTKKAAAEEKERKQRIAEKQKKYNQIYENMDIASSKVEKLVLDIDEETDKPLLEVNKVLVSKLKPHQASGIQFMWDACFESLKRAEKSGGSGCIVAHCMGLGKTLQVIALVDTLLEAAEKTKIRKILVVTPLSTVLNWKAEFENWLSGEEDYDIFELVSCKQQNTERSYYISQWHKNGGVMIMSYAMFRNLSSEKNKKVSKKIRTVFTEGLVDPGPDLVICDEGHLLKNEKTSLSIAMNRIKTRRRIVLTGTPLQNNMKEYYCMVQFVKPNLLGTYREYLNRFVNPITNGQYTDSTDYDINIMRRRSHVLHKLLEGVVQRRDYSVLAPYLPPKFEYVLFLSLTDTQKKLYEHYLKHFARKSKDDSSNRTSYLFQDFQALSRICIHPRVLLDKSVDDQNKYQSDDEESIGSLKNFLDDGDSSSSSASSGSESDGGSGSGGGTKKKRKGPKRVTRAQKAAKNSDSESEDTEAHVEKEWWQEYCDGDELDNLANSTKFIVLFEILKECEQIGDKVLVFSQSLYALNAIEYFLEKVDEATQNGNTDEKTCSYSGSWTAGLDYFRLDGSTNCSLRSNWCDSFNKESNSRARLFLLSTRAGGLGINLVAANRVIIFDVSWNPSSDIQSIYRVYRFGQLKPSYVYRFVMYGTMEMKIYERQVIKQAISKRVIDEQQIDRHYNQSDLGELYKFDQPTAEDRPIPLVPKDVLLADLLQNHEDKIFKYHEHQSLLENKEDETLNEDERKAAWDEFENEKVERTKQTLIGKFSVNTVQLALKSIIQRDNPTWNNSQILSIIPQLIQQLNIQLGAKDMTMYNRIAAEIKLMQEEYARKMQMQFYQYRMQMEAQRQHLGMFSAQRPPLGNYGGYPQIQFMGNPGIRAPVPSSSTFNPNEIVELN